MRFETNWPGVRFQSRSGKETIPVSEMKLTLRVLFLVLLLGCLLSRVWAADAGLLTGKVTDASGKPLARVTVRLVSMGNPRHRFQAVTDKSGRFRIGRLASGEWTVKWKAKGYFEKADLDGGPFPPWRSLSRLMVAPGEHRVVTLVMQPDAVLYGRVTDTDGRPITRRLVWLVGATLPGGGNRTPTFRVRCDGRGFYRMEFGFEREPGFGAYVPGKAGYGPFTAFALEDGKRTRVDLHLVRGASVSGRVLAADGKTPVVGALVASSGAYDYPSVPFHASVERAFRALVQKDPPRPSFGIQGGLSASISFSAQDDTVHVVWETSGTTDAEGYFDLPLNPNIDYTLHAYSPSHPGGSEDDPKVRLRDGEHRPGFIFVLRQ